MRQLVAILVMSSALGLVWPAEAQLPVVDKLNLFQNTISATEALVNTAKWVLELTGLPTFILAEGAFLEDLATLEQIVQDGQAVGMGINSLQRQLALFGLDTAPFTSTGLALGSGEIRSVVNQSYGYAMRTQTLIRTLLNVIRHVGVLINDVRVAVGGLQASQAMAQKQAQLIALQSQLNVQTSAFQHAESVEQLSGPWIEQSSQHMSSTMWADWAEGDIGL
jgi:hypothetical protein